MAKGVVSFLACNRGEISPTALGRLDIEKLRLAAEKQINWMPMAMGPMTLRPGLQYLGSTKSDAACKLLEFVYAADDTSLIELTDSTMRVWTNDALVTRVSVASTLQAYGSWTTVESPSATVTVGSGYAITISGVSRGNVSSAYGTLTISNDDKAKEHALRVVVSKGPVLFKIGTSADDEDVFAETKLAQGTHSLAFTPGATTVYVQISSDVWATRVVDSIAVEAAGTLELPTPWTAANLADISYDQSADVIFVAQKDNQQRRIERHREGGSNNSWSVVRYFTEDGPFPAQGGDDSVYVSPDSVSGDTVLVSNKAIFRDTHINELIRLYHDTQNVVAVLETENVWTDPIRVSGVATYTSGATTVNSDERKFQIDITGTWSGTITLQRTFDPEGITDWVDYATYTTNQTATIINDQFYNVIVWYRLGFKPFLAVESPGSWVWNGYTWVYTGTSTIATGYTSGSAECSLSYKGGGGAGVARIYEYVSPTEVYAEVLTPFKNAGKANNWRISEWNRETGPGFPSAVAIHEGRLWWAGGGKIWGSKSDNYTSFGFEDIGDDASIQRSMGKGPIANIHWLCSLSRLAAGTDSGVVTARSNSFDEPLTPTVFNLKYSMTQGASTLRPVIVDTKAMFVERSGRRVYGMVFSSEAFDYKPLDLTRLNLDIGLEGFTDISVQRQPDTHIRLPRGDGMMANFLYDEDDELSAWWRIQTDGEIENVAVLPGDLEDRVYVVVKRTINGNTKRYLEKFARLDECQGGTISKLADSFIQWAGGSTTTVTGLSHLEGKSVVVWYNGLEVGFDADNPATIATYTVTGGQITVPTAVNAGAIIGLPYTATYVSTKLAYAVEGGAALNKRKKVNALGFSLVNTHFQGVRYGSYREDYSEQTLRSLPRVEFGEVTPTGKIWSSFEQDMMDFPGEINTDTRIVIEGRAPRPATVLGFSADITVAD
jgi:hypothetical protein